MTKNIRLNKNLLAAGIVIFLLCLMAYFSHEGVVVRTVSPQEWDDIYQLWPAYLPSNGLIFLLSIALHFGLLTAALSMWYDYPVIGRFCAVLWLVFILFLFFLAIKSIGHFPDRNPLFFGWHIKWVTFSVVTLLSLFTANLLVKLVELRRFDRELLTQHERLNQAANSNPGNKRHQLLDEYPKFSPRDEKFLTGVINTVIENISNQALDCQFLAEKLCTSEQTLRRRLDKTIGMTPGLFIRNQRLMRAKELYEEGRVSSYKQLAAAVGFKSSSYFMSLYREFMQSQTTP